MCVLLDLKNEEEVDVIKLIYKDLIMHMMILMDDMEFFFELYLSNFFFVTLTKKHFVLKHYIS